jgi:MYXO-CTERM domain-containing protein
LLLTCLFAAATLLVAGPASACSCATGSTAGYFAQADAVFTGSLVSREEPATITSSADPALHVFAVDTVYKGTAHESQDVLSPVSGATCGLELTGEGPFVVFATRSTDIGGQFTTLADDQYAAFLCGGTGPVTPAIAAELTALAERPADLMTAPLPGAAEVEPAASSPVVPALVGIGALLVLVAALLVRRRRAASR